jgi:DNA-binding FrmR family transcriptional regulator
MTVHASHPDIIKRLKRAAGHLKSTIQMLEDESVSGYRPATAR